MVYHNHIPFSFCPQTALSQGATRMFSPRLLLFFQAFSIFFQAFTDLQQSQTELPPASPLLFFVYEA